MLFSLDLQPYPLIICSQLAPTEQQTNYIS